MKNVIPFSKEIIFKTNIAEISSISLEHNYNVVGDGLSGEFIVSGEYKSHELSINKENFKYSLPFNIELDEDIDVNTVKMNIEDFTYDFHEDVLVVKIEYSIVGERIKEEDRKIIIPEAVEIENPEELIDIDNSITEISNEEDIINDSSHESELSEENNRDNFQNTVEIPLEQNLIVEEKKEDTANENKIEEKSEYVTYHVHVLKEEETIESVCKMYDVNMNLIEEYNDLKNIKPKDKIIIPIYQDE